MLAVMIVVSILLAKLDDVWALMGGTMGDVWMLALVAMVVESRARVGACVR